MISTPDWLSVGERLKQLETILKVKSSRQLALSINADPSYFSKAQKGEGISTNYLNELQTKHGVSKEWVLFGKGDPLLPHVLQPQDEEMALTSFHERLRETKLFMKYEPIPSYDVDIAAASSPNQEMFDDKSMRAEDYYYIPEFSGCRAFNVFSDSMEPKIQKGSKIFARRVDDWQEVLEFGQVYAVGLNDGRRFLKIVRKGKNPDTFILKSENPQYDDMDLPKSKIRSMWLIDGWMNKSTQSTYFVLKHGKKA